MATAYTWEVAEGKCTSAREFILQCARGIGYFYRFRDNTEEIRLDADPNEIFPDDSYYLRELPKQRGRLRERLRELETATPEQVSALARAEFEAAERRFQEAQAERTVKRQRYEVVLEKVRAWQDPTPEHRDLKRLCVGQLEDSIKHDCEGAWFGPDPADYEPGPWLKAKIQYLDDSITSNERNVAEEKRRTAAARTYLGELLRSLEGLG